MPGIEKKERMKLACWTRNLMMGRLDPFRSGSENTDRIIPMEFQAVIIRSPRVV